MVTFDRSSHPVRPGLHGHRLLEPLRVRTGQETPPVQARLPGGRVPPAAAEGGLDSNRRAGDRRPGNLGPSAGAVGAQRRPVVPQQHQARLPPALSADVRRLRPHHVRHRPSRRAPLLPVRRQGLCGNRPGAALSARQRQRRRPRARGVGACPRSARSAGSPGDPVPAICRRRRPPCGPGATGRAADRGAPWRGWPAPTNACSTRIRPSGSASTSWPSDAGRLPRNGAHWNTSNGSSAFYAANAPRPKRSWVR